MSAPATRVFAILVRGDAREYVRDRHSEDITLKGMERSCEGDTSDSIFGRGSGTYAGVKRKRASEPTTANPSTSQIPGMLDFPS